MATGEDESAESIFFESMQVSNWICRSPHFRTRSPLANIDKKSICSEEALNYID